MSPTTRKERSIYYGWRAAIIINITIFAVAGIYPANETLGFVINPLGRQIVLSASVAAAILGLIWIVYAVCKFVISFANPKASKARTRLRVSIFLLHTVALEIFLFAVLLFALKESIEKCNCTIYDSLYLSVVTITTVGYGDCYAKEGLARLVTSMEALCGYLTLGLLISSFSSMMTSGGQSDTNSNNV